MIDPMPSDIFQRGQILNNTYEIEGILGRGGTGEVYRARNQIVDRVVAIKALNAQFSGRSDYIELMKREEQMRSIISDSVVRYSECSRTDEGHVFLVMDFIDGPSLNELIVSRRVDAKELFIIAHRVTEGLVATHASGIVHRDLSPDNIILRGGAPEAAVIIDFGIAKDTAAGARTIVGNEFAGKYEYAAPEQLDGHAEGRSDIYSLGALLLAAYRGEIPFPGATPGEIVRRKQVPLDTSDVPEPLKGLIDWMSAPEINDRPASAQTLLDKIGQDLKPAKHQSRHAAARKRKETTGGGAGRKLRKLFAVLAVASAVAGLYFSGLLNDYVKDPLPLAAPYRLSAAFDPAGDKTLTSNSPNAQAEALLRGAYSATTGVDPAALITLATGMPSIDWPKHMQDALLLLKPLQRWQIEVTDTRVTITGLAPEIAVRNTVTSALKSWAANGEYDIFIDVMAGPDNLLAANIQPALDSLQTCGPLVQVAGIEAQYSLSDTIIVTGNIMSLQDTKNIKQVLTPVIGDRKLRFDTTLLNGEICKIRNVLPAVSTQNISIWLGDGDTGAPNLSGIFTVGQNPVVEVQVPSNISQGSLWVMIIDTDGEVYHILPNINATEHSLANLGAIEGGVRRIRVLHSVAAYRADQNLRAFLISEGDFGKSEIVAILSKDPLFDTRRPGTESVASVAQALDDILQNGQGEIVGLATRIIDARR